jgi:DNA repair ATPase RecN
LALARYCQTSYRTRKPLVDALERTKQELTSAKRLVVEEQSKIASLQYDNGILQAAAQQAGEVEELQAEVRRLQHLELERNQFSADLEAFRRLEVDVRNLDTFRKNKDVILQYMKLLPTVVE